MVLPAHIIQLLVLVVGGVLYVAADGKPSEMGRMMFFAGLLAYLLSLGR